MNQFRYAHVVLAVGFVFAVTAPVRADDAADARAIIEKAVKAHGGQDKIEKFTGTTIKFKGAFHGGGDQAIAMTGEIAAQGFDKHRIDIEVDAGGNKLPIVIVLNGDKGWNKFGKDVAAMDKDKLEEAKHSAYAGWVTTLAPLKDKQFKLATIGEIKVDKRAAVGVKVSSKGHRDIDLYFDKETGLLVKTEKTVKDDAGNEVNEEAFPSDYKDVKGTKQAHKFTVKRSGKLHVEGEATEITLSEKLDASVFAEPK